MDACGQANFRLVPLDFPLGSSSHNSETTPVHRLGAGPDVAGLYSAGMSLNTTESSAFREASLNNAQVRRLHVRWQACCVIPHASMRAG